MRSWIATRKSRLLFWLRVREFAVPALMIEAATARRTVGDWAGACAAARVDVDLDLRTLARDRGTECATQVRADLRHLAPDLLRWHLPRIAPDGVLRPGLTISLARYPPSGGTGALHLVARTPPAWADGGQRISLALWGARRAGKPGRHPHPRPDRWFRLDLHRHLWDARRVQELRQRSGVDELRGAAGSDVDSDIDSGCAVHRWPDEAALVLQHDGRPDGPVTVRLGARRRRVLHVGPARDTPSGSCLPHAATWIPPDLELLREGLIEADQLHPLVGPALGPGNPMAQGIRVVDGTGDPHVVECRGARHRIGLVNRVLVPLDHGPDEVRREELLIALGGPPLPCLRAIDELHRRPQDLVDIRARIDHGDTAGALAAVERLLGPDALLRNGPLRDELESAADRRIAHGLYRSGLMGRIGAGRTR